MSIEINQSSQDIEIIDSPTNITVDQTTNTVTVSKIINAVQVTEVTHTIEIRDFNPAEFSAAAHTHDDRYYTETEVDTLLADKAAVSHNHDTDYAALSHSHGYMAHTHTESDITDLQSYALAAHNHNDVYYTEAEVDTLLTNSTDWDTAYGWGDHAGLYADAVHTHVEADITDLQAYLTAEVNDLSSVVTWANVPDVNITESSVTQHEAALSITESQISDLGSYLENVVEDTTPQLGGNLDLNGNVITVGASATIGDDSGNIDFNVGANKAFDFFSDSDQIMIISGASGGYLQLYPGSKIATDTIDETTADTGVTVDGLLIKDSGIPEAAVTTHESALTITEAQVSDLGTYIENITAEDLGDLSDVTASVAGDDGKFLKYDHGSGLHVWTSIAGGGDLLAANNLSDVADAATSLANLGGAASGGAEHDGFSDFVANEHIDWTQDQGATNIHAGNYTDTDTTYVSSDFVHDNLTGFEADEHINWTLDRSPASIHSANYVDNDTTYVSSDFNHDDLTGFVANEHIDWTSTSENFDTSGTLASGSQTITGTIQPTSWLIMPNNVAIRAKETGGTQRGIFYISGSDAAVVGSTAIPMTLNSSGEITVNSHLRGTGANFYLRDSDGFNRINMIAGDDIRFYAEDGSTQVARWDEVDDVFEFPRGIATDTVDELGSGSGVTVDGLLIKDGLPTMQAGCSVTMSVDQTVSNTTTETIEFDTEQFDIGSDFNTGTHGFTAPSTGYYLISVNATMLNLDDGKFQRVFIKVDAAIAAGSTARNTFYSGTNNAENATSVTVVEHLTAGDVVTFAIYHNNGANLSLDASFTNASIMLMGI